MMRVLSDKEVAEFLAKAIKLPIYAASRASLPERPKMWQNMRANGWNIVSSWIDEAGPGETKDRRDLWLRIHGEIARSMGLIFYAEPGDFPFKGAMVEIGMALGMGKPVALVLPGVELEGDNCRPVGSWMEHPNVVRSHNLDYAAMAIASSWGAR